MKLKIYGEQNTLKVIFSLLCLTLLTISANAQTEFITTWQTTNANEAIVIPTIGSGYDYTVDWGDGNVDVSQSTDATHTYSIAGTYTVSISGDFPRIYFNNTGDKDKILSVEQWGSISWTSMNVAFFGCSNLIITATDSPDLSAVTDLSSMFQNATSLNQDIGFWNTSNILNMSSMFKGASLFNQDIGFWNTGNVTDLSYMFRDASKFNRDISAWDTNEVLNMKGVFQNAVNFNQDIFLWNVEKVTAFNTMFNGAALSTSNYDALLIAWLAQDLNEGIIFSAGNSIYCSTAAQAARILLITPTGSGGKGWLIIQDGGKSNSLSFGRANEYITISENTTDVALVRAINPTVSAITYAITAGVDAAIFFLGAVSGNLEFIVPPVFDSPLDANADNIYEVEVTATVTATMVTDVQTIYVEVIENNAFIWNGATDFSWLTPSNWLGGVVPASDDRVRIINGSANYPIIESDVEIKSLEMLNISASLTIASNSLKISENLNISSGVLTVESGASLLPLGSASGSINVKRNTTFGKTEDKYSIVGSPVTVGVTSVLGNPIYEYDETIPYDAGGTNGSDRFVLNTATVMDIGEAYFSANTGNASFFGPPNTGNIDIPLVYNLAQDGAGAGFNLVSNPYTAAISYDSFVAANPDIDGTIYLWDDGGSDTGQRTNSDYVTANTMGAASGGSGRAASWDGYIRSAQGFFVKATTAGTLSFTPSMMSIGNNSDDGFFRKEEPVVSKFSLSSEHDFNEILIGFTDKASDGIDRSLDAYKIKSNSNLQFYSRMNDAILAIQALPVLNESSAVDLGFDIAEAGAYTLAFQSDSNFDFGVYLKDNLLDKMIDLSENKTYTFETTAVQNSNRFSLIFSPDKILHIGEQVIKDEMIVFSNNTTLNIRMNKEYKNAKVSIYNLSGTLVKEENQVDFTGTDWTTTFNQEGLFIITVQTEGQLFVKKFVR